MKLTVSQMLVAGGIGAVVIILLSMMNWRRAVHAALITALLEGALRKWVLPQASELVYFLKDIILFGAYLKFFMFPDPEDRGWRLNIPHSLIVSVVFILVLAGALNPNIGSPLLAAYGLKIYIWYLPLGLMMPLLFRNEAHMIDLLYRYSLFAIPICLLGAAQFVAPVDSWINTYATSDYAGVKQVATFGTGQAARARVTGTFSYIGGHTTFVVVFFILSLSLLVNLEGQRRLVLLLGSLPLLLGNALMTGSRGTVFYLLLITVLVVSVSAVTKVGKTKNAILYLVAGLGVAVIGVSVAFEKAYQAFDTRRKTAGDSEAGRALHSFYAVTHAVGQVDLIGFGIGTSHPATLGIRRALRIPDPKKPCPYYDNETGQVMAELGWIGFLMWYGLRAMMLYHCWDAFRRAPPSFFRTLSLGFFVYHLLMLMGQMVLNHTANIFLCASWGFCLIPRLQTVVRRQVPITISSAPSPQTTFRGSKVPRRT